VARRVNTKVKGVTFRRVTGTTIENRRDPEYRACLGNPGMHPVLPEVLRYDLAFVHPSDPALVAFPKFTSGYGGRPTVGKWESHGYRLERVDAASARVLSENFERGAAEWYTFRRPAVHGRPRNEALVRVPLSAFLALRRNAHPSEAQPPAVDAWCQECHVQKVADLRGGELCPACCTSRDSREEVDRAEKGAE